MQMPTPEQVKGMMKERFGEVPEAIENASKVDEALLVEQAVSSKLSMMSEKNALDPKTSTLVFLAAAIAMGDDACVRVNTAALKKMGARNEEILSVVRIVRHAAASIAVDRANGVFETLAE
ncbi:carboxymuconolactone decarboxylase family protein [Hydrogenimonas sp. SS33]|uniref:carboxymuconolactone decarboxylase family protein n=1 Tax=Hydrogenimonas leucolamina TaxID=2954236 RepID=UPI00336BF621